MPRRKRGRSVNQVGAGWEVAELSLKEDKWDVVGNGPLGRRVGRKNMYAFTSSPP